MNPQEEGINKNPYLATIAALILISVFLGTKFFAANAELQQTKAVLATKMFNDKIIIFNRTFIEKVLKSSTEVSFEDRLRLENSVRDLNDKDILDRWNKFVASKTEREAQDNVKELLDLLAQKIKV